jgi:MFS transporter, ACS family, hexuronate transporter
MQRRFTIPKLGWVIAGLLFLITLINYTDRMALSVLIGQVRADLHLSETDYSHIVTFFLAAYAIMYAVSGYIVDRLGTRRGLALFVISWSVAQMLHGLAIGKWSLAGCRFLLGLTEPGNFPAATKAIREWFPPRQRALGVGIFNLGSSLGAAVAAPVAAFIGLHYGWRAAFVATGALGLAWIGIWLILYQAPERNRWLSQRELAELQAEGLGSEPAEVRSQVNWLSVFRSRPCVMLILARFLSDPVIYFIIFWLPAYLQKERGFGLEDIGKFGWVPYTFGGLGYLIGGWFSGKLISRGWSLPNARKAAMALGAGFLPAAILAPLMPTAGLAIAASSFVVLGHAIWVANLLTLPADIFPSGQVGTASGLSGMGGSVGGILATLLTGYIVTRFSYTPLFVWAGLMHPLAFLLIWRLLPNGSFIRDTLPPVNRADPKATAPRP